MTPLITTEPSFSAPGKREAATKTILAAKAALDSIGVPFWLVCGTLLGAMREHDFIAHDSDIDIGIWDLVADDHRYIQAAFIEAGFRPAQEFGSRGHGHQYAFWSPWDVYFDIYFLVSEPECCWLSVWVDGKLGKLCYQPITQFDTIQFCGAEFLVPSNWEQQFIDQYGPDWRTPVAPVERGGTYDWRSSAENTKWEGE